MAFFLTTVFLTFLSLRASHPPHVIDTSSVEPPKAGISAFFSFRAPFSLFPPNAIITLTHENSTAFLARPAAFGPSLPAEGLKGQVWIGSGFGDDSIRQGPMVAGAEGELGCSDVPGWVETVAKSAAAVNEGGKSSEGKSAATTAGSKVHDRGSSKTDKDDRAGSTDATKGASAGKTPAVDDGTDDYLHHPLPESTVSKAPNKQTAESKENHADIQSIQEGAEIAGKVVLLSRGGCGFLEKSKWAQRRGAIALIVGDDTKGGPLIQMYARGDTSNVTIPSIFTSRTTAHLLSSLIGPGSFLADSIDENGKPTLKVQHSDKTKKKGKKHKAHTTFTPTAAANQPQMTARGSTKSSSKKPTAKVEDKPAAITTQSPGWFRSLFFGSGKSGGAEASRPPSSGQLDWVLVDEWKDDDSPGAKKATTRPGKIDGEKKASPKNKPNSKPANSKPTIPTTDSDDDFVIGVQDWRDPDLVGSTNNEDGRNDNKEDGTTSKKQDATKPKPDNPRPTKAGPKKHIGGVLQDSPENSNLEGGSITPGSGEYETKAEEEETKSKDDHNEASSKPKGLLTTIFGDDEEEAEFLMPESHKSVDMKSDEPDEEGDGDDDEYEGLWVTLTPTSGASPFLDTLLVLVVSPLVTLTIVYALLLVRSRIRRRRWRAPKSVVERLPVRTYQTIATPNPQSPRVPNPTGTSATTPLLQQSPPSRPRPRSRTTTGVPEPSDLIRASSNPLEVPAIPPRTPEHEKLHGSHTSEWKKYMGKQVECVVCLEEYVDGVSRVMSLPCGHEFHVDCITPWLTTRRRTCPICKGDVVRSLARGSPSSPRYDAYQDDSDDDLQEQVASASNASSSALPITGSSGSDNDIEQGRGSTPTRPRRTNRTGSWRSMLASSLGSGSRTPLRTQEDRDR